MASEYIIYTDESSKSGPYFGNFSGGALIRSTDLAQVTKQLDACKMHLGLGAEVKWQKVTQQYLDKYLAFVSDVFRFVRADQIKVRVMFTQHFLRPAQLASYHREHAFHILYYQFLKHCFGLRCSGTKAQPRRVRVYLDRLPNTREKNLVFKSHVAALSQSSEFRRAGVVIAADQVAEVESHEHVILQALDVILGSIQFRLNDHHKAKPPGARTRGKKTIAKELLYKEINRQIRRIYPNFNVGISTGTRGDKTNRWFDAYRHWRFEPTGSTLDPTRTKPK